MTWFSINVDASRIIFGHLPAWERACASAVCKAWHSANHDDPCFWEFVVVVQRLPSAAELLGSSDALLPPPELLLHAQGCRVPPATRSALEHHAALEYAHQGALPLLLSDLRHARSEYIRKLVVLDAWSTYTGAPKDALKALCNLDMPRLEVLRLPLSQLLTTQPESARVSEALRPALRSKLVEWLHRLPASLAHLDLEGADCLEDFTDDRAFIDDAKPLQLARREGLAWRNLSVCGQFTLALGLAQWTPAWDGLQVVQLTDAAPSEVVRLLQRLRALRRLGWFCSSAVSAENLRDISLAGSAVGTLQASVQPSTPVPLPACPHHRRYTPPILLAGAVPGDAQFGQTAEPFRMVLLRLYEGAFARTCSVAAAKQVCPA